MEKCVLCGWEGEDVLEAADGKGSTTYVCMACRVALAIGAQSKTVGKMLPIFLVPVLRVVVAQSVGAMLGQIISGFIQATGKHELNTLVDMLKNTGSTDPN